MKLQPHQKALLWASAITIPFWVVSGLQMLLLPLVLLNTHIHELCHALAGVVTGGGAKEIIVNADTSGVTNVFGGWPIIVAPAGYVGTAVVGGLMIALSGTEKGARRMLWTLCGFLAFSMAVFVRGDLIGVLSGFVWVIATALLARHLRKEHAIVAAQFLGLQLCMSSFFSFLTLWQLSAASMEHSDAQIMAQASGVPAIVWATGWMLMAAVVVFFALRASWKGSFKS
jgi:hypothetical protein